MWQDIMGVFETSLVYGQNQGYYETIYVRYKSKFKYLNLEIV